MSEQTKPFDQWHPDAQRQCGFWWDLSPIACGQCERCRKEQRFHPVAPVPSAGETSAPQEPTERQHCPICDMKKPTGYQRKVLRAAGIPIPASRAEAKFATRVVVGPEREAALRTNPKGVA